MSVRRANATTSKIDRVTVISSNRNKVNTNPIQSKNAQKKDSKILDKKRNIKVDYNNNNYYYQNNNNEEYYNDYNYNNKDEYYDKGVKKNKYDQETSDSYITVEQEDGQIKYIPKNYLDYKRSAPKVYTNNNNNKKMDYYDENSDDSENNDNEDMYYENDEEYEQEMIENNTPMSTYNNKYQKINNYYLTQDNNKMKNRSKKGNQNVITRPINHQINYTKDIKRKDVIPGGNVHNCGNNTTTTNNTYNNNIYYINPISVKNRSKNKKEETNNKSKKSNRSQKNTVYKNVDITIGKKKPQKEKDYFRMNNIERSQRQKYINAAILIQSIFRGYLIKIKLYNNVNLYVCCKRAVNILENIFLSRKKLFWKLFNNFISLKLYDDIINSKVNLNILKEYIRKKKDIPRVKKINSFHKELGDSFNIIIDNKQKENAEKTLKSKLNDVIKENTELKNQLEDNKNIEEKMKNLIDENKKNRNINDIIMKDNQQLAKKLKDMQDYRNTNLIVQNQSSLDLQDQKLQIEELIINTDIYLDKLKHFSLEKLVNKLINKRKNVMKDKFNTYKQIIEKEKSQEKEKSVKELYFKNTLDKLANKIKLIKQKYFYYLYYNTKLIDIETKSKSNLINEKLEKIIKAKEEKTKLLLYKNFIKYFTNSKEKEEEDKEEKKLEQDKEEKKGIFLNKIIKKCEQNQKLIYKVFIEKWNLKAKIIGMRTAARDKKKKRKLKKKIIN